MSRGASSLALGLVAFESDQAVSKPTRNKVGFSFGFYGALPAMAMMTLPIGWRGSVGLG